MYLQVTDVIYEAVEGDPRNVLCETVEKYHADVLVVGSHGYGAIKRYRNFSLFIIGFNATLMVTISML